MLGARSGRWKIREISAGASEKPPEASKRGQAPKHRWGREDWMHAKQNTDIYTEAEDLYSTASDRERTSRN